MLVNDNLRFNAECKAPALDQLEIGLFGQFDAEVYKFFESCRTVVHTDIRQFDISDCISRLDGIVIRSPFSLRDQDARLADRLRWIVRAGSGTDNISPLFRERGIDVRSTPVNAYSVAELVIGLILGLLRNVRPGHESLRRGEWKKQALVGRELRGKTVGILGYGRIGRELSKLLSHFGTTILAYDRSPDAAEKVIAAESSKTSLIGMDDVIKHADILVACLPGSSQTKQLLDRARLNTLRRGAILVNVGRGSLIDIDALTELLESGHLNGAALDVFTQEPPGALRLFDLDNVLCTPHLGAQTYETHRNMANEVIRHLRELTGFSCSISSNHDIK